MVAVLLDDGRDGEWAAKHMAGANISAPALMPFEVANIIRRSELASLVSSDVAAQAYDDCQRRAMDLWPFELLAARVWQLRHNLTAYDASYVALAELLDVPLVTLDQAIGKVPGLHCEVLTPDQTDRCEGGTV